VHRRARLEGDVVQNQFLITRIEAQLPDRCDGWGAVALKRQGSIFIQRECQHITVVARAAEPAALHDVAASFDADARARRPLRREAVAFTSTFSQRVAGRPGVGVGARRGHDFLRRDDRRNDWSTIARATGGFYEQP